MENEGGENGDVRKHMRICCLEPSATAICLALGLAEYLVGVTHECHEILTEHNDQELISRCHVVTKNGLKADATQGEIHQAVQDTAASAASCKRRNDKELDFDDIPTLYPLVEDEWRKANPNIVFTQDLCAVCAPTTVDVRNLLVKTTDGADNQDNCEAEVTIVSLQPSTLQEVAETFVTVARTCGILDRGLALKEQFLQGFASIKSTIQENLDAEEQASSALPRIFILEWLDPPFDSGHWTYQMMDFANIRPAKPKSEPKSKHIRWEEIYDANPDVVMVGCCGFDLPRNIQDTLSCRSKLSKLRAAREGRIYACNGNIYIAQPGPALLTGAAILAQCAYQHHPKVTEALSKLNFSSPIGEGWQKVDVIGGASDSTVDIEDLTGVDDCKIGFAKIHQEACDAGKHTYIDPASGYQVFTEIAHKKRGKCCGSGCRHCPYSHQNVKDKASKISQPAFLSEANGNDGLFNIRGHDKIKVLFFSGGKDSFLTIRALARSYYNDSKFGLVLLTTFDATSRIIAHQEIHVDQVIKQAQHLNISLVGVPLRRGSGETYVERAQKGIRVIESKLSSSGTSGKITSLAFGDLHLDHVKTWRDSALTSMGYELEYPLWKVPFTKLIKDLDESQVPCILSASTVDGIQAGERFTREFHEKIMASTTQKIDGFGENGEFHTLAQVWQVSRQCALGIVGKE